MNATATVLMCIYNESPRFLTQAVTSILAQTFRAFTVLLIDDGSTASATKRCISDLAARDRRIIVHEKDHSGLTKSLNAGLKFCKSKYILRHDGDDWSEPDRFRAQIEFLEANPSHGLVGSNVMLHQESGTPLWVRRLPQRHGEIMRAYFTFNPFIHGAICFRSKCLESVGGYREDFACSQDLELTWRICQRSSAANLGRVLYHWRFNSKSITANRRARQLEMTSVFRREVLGNVTPDISRGPLDMISKASDPESDAMYRADNYLVAGRYGAALKLYLELLQKHPLRACLWARMLRWLVFLESPVIRAALFRKDRSAL